MLLLNRVVANLVVFWIACGCAVAQSAASCSTRQATAPCVDRIDPPNWWANMPSPMLLLHGNHLNNAHFLVRGKNVDIVKTQISENGHWAFLWLNTANAAPQTLTIEITSTAGSIKKQFELLQRNLATAGFKGFSPNDVMYLIMIDRFANGDTSNDKIGDDDGGRTQPRGWYGGDFRGIENHLDYLQQLGVTTLWLTPIQSNTRMKESYHGYAATDLYATDPHFGTVEDYQKLVKALHARGMKIVLDTVPNHVGVEIMWVNDPPAPNWFHGTRDDHSIAKSPFRYLPDPHATPRDTANITEGWFTSNMPDMNQENPLVAKYLIQNTIWWIETARIDGLREDTFPYVGRQFWSDFHQQIHMLYPHLTAVGEVFAPEDTIVSYFAGGVKHSGIDTGLTTPFDYPLQFTLRNVLAHGKPMTALEETLGNDWLYPQPQNLVTFFGNHDLKRFLSEPGASVASLKIAFGLIATMRGMPQLYSGDEIAMRGGDDPDNRHAFPGGFPGDTTNAFTQSGRTPEQQEVFSWVQGLLQLRANEPELTQAQQQNIFADDTTFAFVRGSNLETGCQNGGSRVLVITQKDPVLKHLQLKTAQTALNGCEHFVQLFPSASTQVQATNSSFDLDIPSNSFLIYRVTQ
ncbi:MAG TPA: alpha-amylase family glycosyl hydrolase [Pseudacidobacterium sp.]|nr:alpha-amylase family glycosyl hydrolase [Pseudacidobacterium sp.]